MRILVTGASRGIGRAIAIKLAQPGRTLALHARSMSHLAETAAACRQAGAEVELYEAHLDQLDEVKKLAEVRVDMLVNNAGVSGTEKMPWEITAEELRTTLDINVVAPFVLSSALIKNGGRYIVDLSSGAAVTDHDTSADYWMSKTALMRLAGSIHLASDVKIFSVAPGVVETDMTHGMRMHDGRTEWTDVDEVASIIDAISHGELDGLAGTHIRAGSDELYALRERSIHGVDDKERKLRLTAWADDHV